MALMVSLGPGLTSSNKTSKQNKMYEVILSEIGQQSSCFPLYGIF